ncbi:IS66 family transposase [Gemmata obscuriglobus]|uniref:IS66 family transposase n=1 Tax=Gemmata obscuriglobus TaxID=114 RepID=A0A2Z3H2Q5_9BACT|nr:IS66 family transposase [Gemmata obscuriglobus]
MASPTLPPEVFDALPPAVQAYIRYLEARLGQNSTNSSKPPSSDPPHVKAAPPKAPSSRRKGGQPGHPKHSRSDLPADNVIELRPSTCDRCAHALSGGDAQPLRHQIIELPPVCPQVTEYRRHRLACPNCGRINRPPLPGDARGGYGPRVQAVCALLSGAYRIGKRGVARLCQDLSGVPISPAAVCGLQRKAAVALGPVVEEARAYVVGKPANVDETGWPEGRKRGWLWAAVTARVTVFLVRLSRARKVLGELIAGHPGVLTTDRYSAYDHLPVCERQVCWAHLRRDFQAMIDRGNGGSGVGEDLLTYADILLDQWKRVRDGTLTRRGFRQTYLGWLRAGVRGFLKRGAEGACAITAGVCRELMAVEPALYSTRPVNHTLDGRVPSPANGPHRTGSSFAEYAIETAPTKRSNASPVFTWCWWQTFVAALPFGNQDFNNSLRASARSRPVSSRTRRANFTAGVSGIVWRKASRCETDPCSRMLDNKL